MNELIKKLAEQASNEYLSEMEPVTDTLSTAKRNELAQKAKQAGIGIIPHGFSEKFAQLIVKETMQVVANQLPGNQYLDVAHAVIEHFGVEEHHAD